MLCLHSTAIEMTDVFGIFVCFSAYQSCNMEKSFLFDVVSKVYIATDSNPVDMQSYELCSDMIDVVIDVSCIYGSVIAKYG